jgi:general secretion pathway protein J
MRVHGGWQLMRVHGASPRMRVHGASPRMRVHGARRRMPAEHGFTLIEVVVALVVLGFVLAGLAQASRFGMTAWSLETRMADHAAGLERMDRVIRQLVEQASPPVSTDDKPFSGQEHRLQFMTLLPDEPQTEPVRHAQVALGVDDKHQLVLRWQIHANAMVLQGLPPAQEIVLASGIERIDMAYRHSLADGGKWDKLWGEGPLPAVVRIHFVLANGRHRWPDMEVAPMLDSNGSF